jgi:nitric oxide reductase subunit B
VDVRLRERWGRVEVAVAFWNLVGAGLFGFLINPPIALYYMQGLNTTPVHAHTALFGVYGLLSLGLMLVVARLMTPGVEWKEQWLGRAFWAMNVGLGLMVGLTLLHIGLMQTYASIETGCGTRAAPSSCSSRSSRTCDGCVSSETRSS